MNVETTLESNAQFAETSKPGMRALDDPAMPSEPLLAFHTATSDTGRDATLLQVTPTASKVVALVRMQFARTFAGLTIQARHGRNGIERGFECHRIVPVSPRDRDSEWNTSRIYDDVSF
jgi:hypothetical protein